MNSLTFNGVDLGAHGLIVRAADIDGSKIATQLLQLKDRAYGSIADREPKIIDPNISVYGSSKGDLKGKLDFIKLTLNQELDKQLIFDKYPDRYFMAKKVDLDGKNRGPYIWEGHIRFECAIPLGYGVVEVATVHTIDADPKTVTETPGGTGSIRPVYLLTATAALGAVIVLLKNTTTDEQLRWTGTLANTNTLEIDTVTWLVKKNGVASMATMSGQFPTLLPAQANSLKVTGIASATLTVTYRNRFI